VSLGLFSNLSPQFILVIVSYDWECPDFFFFMIFHAVLTFFEEAVI